MPSRHFSWKRFLRIVSHRLHQLLVVTVVHRLPDRAYSDGWHLYA